VDVHAGNGTARIIYITSFTIYITASSVIIFTGLLILYIVEFNPEHNLIGKVRFLCQLSLLLLYENISGGTVIR
jgi:hypothetical protein